MTLPILPTAMDIAYAAAHPARPARTIFDRRWMLTRGALIDAEWALLGALAYAEPDRAQLRKALATVRAAIAQVAAVLVAIAQVAAVLVANYPDPTGGA